MKIKVNSDIIKSLGPCKDRLVNYLKHYNELNFDILEFLALDKISAEYKVWVSVRLMPKELVVAFARDCASRASTYADKSIAYAPASDTSYDAAQAAAKASNHYAALTASYYAHAAADTASYTAQAAAKASNHYAAFTAADTASKAALTAARAASYAAQAASYTALSAAQAVSCAALSADQAAYYAALTASHAAAVSYVQAASDTLTAAADTAYAEDLELQLKSIAQLIEGNK